MAQAMTQGYGLEELLQGMLEGRVGSIQLREPLTTRNRGSFAWSVISLPLTHGGLSLSGVPWFLLKCEFP